MFLTVWKHNAQNELLVSDVMYIVTMDCIIGHIKTIHVQ